MPKIAILQFPGTNCEYETRRAARAAGVDAQLVRWNESAQKLSRFSGYIIPGGFSYEDRVRSGAIAARDEALKTVAAESAKGKPVLGICNGAQILVEAGLIPGLEASEIGAALARNKYGWLNIWTRIVNAAPRSRCAFNNFREGHHFALPIAHGEGRFTVPRKVLRRLIRNQQTVFRYADETGKAKDTFPINPNGTMYNVAGVSNAEGNVLALMPHPERVSQGHVIFDSMKKYLTKTHRRKIVRRASSTPHSLTEHLPRYQAPKNSAELFVELIITDNEAVTLENALRQMGFSEVRVSKKVHWEIQLTSSRQAKQALKAVMSSGELFNPNKEIGYLKWSGKFWRQAPQGLRASETVPYAGRRQLLVRYRADEAGANKRKLLATYPGGKAVKAVRGGTVWQIEASEPDWQRLRATHILANPFSQHAALLTI